MCNFASCLVPLLLYLNFSQGAVEGAPLGMQSCSNM